MTKKRILNENDTFNLNFGVPLVLGIALFIVNMEFFAIVFLEKIAEMVTIYMYVTFIVIAIIFITSKKNQEGIKEVMISFYDLLVHNSALALIFLLINYTFSEPIYNKQIAYDVYYKNALSKNNIPSKYLKVFDIRYKEDEKYFNNGHYILVQIDKSIFGYEFIKTREFIKE